MSEWWRDLRTECSTNSDLRIRVIDPTTGGAKDTKLARFDLIPPGPMRKLAVVYGYGCMRTDPPPYAPRNWERGYAWGLGYAALQRHLHAFWGGQTLDPDSGLSHLAHAAWYCLALMEWETTHPELDDRPSPPAQGGTT